MTFLDKLLKHFKLSNEDYEELTRPLDELSLPDCSKFLDMEKATSIIHDSIENNEKIVIYGDYDCDGIMATSILYNTFKKINYEVGYYIPSRYLDGYGLNEARVQEMYDKGYKLIITVDNGISALEPIRLAKKLGMKVIVTDHHESKEELPDADAILHPIISKYGDVYCCGAYVSYMLACALLNRSDDYLLSLASIATISDMMELVSYNRDIVRLGISKLNEHHYLPIELLKGDINDIDEDVIGMTIAPRINAVGRLVKSTKINRLVKYFSSEDENEVRALSKLIIDINDKRKAITKNVFMEFPKIGDEPIVILSLDDIEEGLIGLVASRIVNEYHKPSIILTKDHNDPSILKGSARSINGLALNLAFKEVEDLLLTYGGHELAGGLSLKEENLEEFKKRFMVYASNHPLIEAEPPSIEISIIDVNETNYNILRTLSPFGHGFSEPYFKIKSLKVDEIKYSSNGQHILYPIGLNQKIVGFNLPINLIKDFDFVSIIGYLKKNYYQGYTSINFNIKEILTLSGVKI